jgi:RluA family pseudouridine synthase
MLNPNVTLMSRVLRFVDTMGIGKQAMDFETIHSDNSILVVNKPTGLPVLPDGWKIDAPYLLKILEESYGKIWIVHRLDKITSGVMVFARTAEAHRALNIQFEKHEAQKIYHAIMVGVPEWEEKIARHPLRVNVGHKHRTAVDPKAGKDSETRFKVINRYPSHVLVEAVLMTGRTHQIRAHAYALGHPLLGDILYSAPQTELIQRPALHAYILNFNHPEKAERVSFTSPYPNDFSNALDRLIH